MSGDELDEVAIAVEDGSSCEPFPLVEVAVQADSNTASEAAHIRAMCRAYDSLDLIILNFVDLGQLWWFNYAINFAPGMLFKVVSVIRKSRFPPDRDPKMADDQGKCFHQRVEIGTYE